MFEENAKWVLRGETPFVKEFEIPKWPSKSLFVPKPEIKLMIIDALKNQFEWEVFKEKKYQSQYLLLLKTKKFDFY